MAATGGPGIISRAVPLYCTGRPFGKIWTWHRPLVGRYIFKGAPLVFQRAALWQNFEAQPHWWAGIISRALPLYFTARPFGKISKKSPAHRKIPLFSPKGEKNFFSRAGNGRRCKKEREVGFLSFHLVDRSPAREKKIFSPFGEKTEFFGGRATFSKFCQRVAL